MGSSPATGELNKALRSLFAHLKDTFVIHDDLIVAGKSKQEHDQSLEEVCKIIEGSGMTLNFDKCIFGKTEIPWWGLMISNKGISPHPEKVQSLKNISPPSNKDELRSFFCMVQSNSDFLPQLARNSIHMRKLLKKHARFIWSHECQTEFDSIKSNFQEDILLRYFDPDLKTYIYVDAHQSGLSAVLTQGNNRGESKVVAVASRATTDTETRYPQIDLEALSIDFALRRFRFYVAGGPKVTIITDHKPLIPIFNKTRTGSIRSERIRLRHQDLDYKVEWEKGITNMADYLSRHALP